MRARHTDISGSNEFQLFDQEVIQRQIWLEIYFTNLQRMTQIGHIVSMQTTLLNPEGEENQ